MDDPFLSRSAGQRSEYFERQQATLQRLASEGQSPEALFIGCSDSRVVPEQLFGARAGDMFMLRVVANLVPPYWQTEIGIASVLEFAVLDLQTPHAIVCGHTDCGGIRALDQTLDSSTRPAIGRWLDLARPAQREVDAQAESVSSVERHASIVERNVVHQLRNLQTYPFVQRALDSAELQLHGWVYYLERQEIGVYDSAADNFIVA